MFSNSPGAKGHLCGGSGQATETTQRASFKWKGESSQPRKKQKYKLRLLRYRVNTDPPMRLARGKKATHTLVFCSGCKLHKLQSQCGVGVLSSASLHLIRSVSRGCRIISSHRRRKGAENTNWWSHAKWSAMRKTNRFSCDGQLVPCAVVGCGAFYNQEPIANHYQQSSAICISPHSLCYIHCAMSFDQGVITGARWMVQNLQLWDALPWCRDYWELKQAQAALTSKLPPLPKHSNKSHW